MHSEGHTVGWVQNKKAVGCEGQGKGIWLSGSWRTETWLLGGRVPSRRRPATKTKVFGWPLDWGAKKIQTQNGQSYEGESGPPQQTVVWRRGQSKMWPQRGEMQTQRSNLWKFMPSSSSSCLQNLWPLILPGQSFSPWYLLKTFLGFVSLGISFSDLASLCIFSTLLLFDSCMPVHLVFISLHIPQFYPVSYHSCKLFHGFSLSSVNKWVSVIKSWSNLFLFLQADAEVTLGPIEAFQGTPLKANCFSQSTPVGLDCLGWKRCVSSFCKYSLWFSLMHFGYCPLIHIHLGLTDGALADGTFETRTFWWLCDVFISSLCACLVWDKSVTGTAKQIVHQ